VTENKCNTCNINLDGNGWPHLVNDEWGRCCQDCWERHCSAEWWAALDGFSQQDRRYRFQLTAFAVVLLCLNILVWISQP